MYNVFRTTLASLICSVIQSSSLGGVYIGEKTKLGDSVSFRFHFQECSTDDLIRYHTIPLPAFRFTVHRRVGTYPTHQSPSLWPSQLNDGVFAQIQSISPLEFYEHPVRRSLEWEAVTAIGEPVTQRNHHWCLRLQSRQHAPEDFTIWTNWCW